MLLAHQSKLAAQEGVNLTNATLKRLKITKLAKTAATATTTVSKETTSVEKGATNTTKLGQSTLGKAAKTDIELLSKAVIYTYWDDYGQFIDTKNRKTGHYSNSTYTGVKEHLSYNTAHHTDQKMKAIMLEGVNEFDAVFQKYEKISTRNPKATL